MEKTTFKIEGLDTDAAMQLVHNEKLYLELIKDYYRMIERRANHILEYEETEDWKNYTIEVHALKSASRQVGALELGDAAARLEQAGNEEDAVFIHNMTKPLVDKYVSYLSILEPYGSEEGIEESEKKLIHKEELLQFLEQVREACDDLDMDAVEEIVKEMEHYNFIGKQKKFFTQLKEAAGEWDTDACEEVVNQWMKL